KKDFKLYKEKVKNEKALIFIFEQQDSKDKYPDLVKRITPKDIKKYILGHLPELSPETRFKLVID
ncbi:MAG: hypothetical protein U9O53_01100, partial [archaeon]|nr:hypothetical protein [archaeon]